MVMYIRRWAGIALIGLGLVWPGGLSAQEGASPVQISRTGDTSAGAEPIAPYVAQGVHYDQGTGQFKIDQAQINLVAPVNTTIQDDLHIRITDDGWAFLANVLKINLIGIVPKSEVDAGRGPTKAADTLHALLNDEVIGIIEAFNIADVGGGQLHACLILNPRRRGTNLECECRGNATTTYGGRTIYSCENCYANTDLTQVQAPNLPSNNPSPGANWTYNNVFYLPNGPIWLRDPYDPAGIAGTPQQFYFGPFFKEALQFELYSMGAGYVDSSASASDGVPTSLATETIRQNAFVNGDCVIDGAGNYPNGNCFPQSPKVGIDLANADGTPDSNPAIVIQLNLYNLAVHGNLGLDSGNCGDWVDPLCDALSIVTPLWIDGTSAGLMSLPGGFLHAKLYARMIDGYWSMVGSEGSEVSTGGGGPTPPATISCVAGSSSSTGCTSNNQCPAGHTCTSGECVVSAGVNILQNASNSYLLSVYADLDPDTTKGAACTWNSIYGFCSSGDLNLEITIFGGILDFLNNLVESIAEPLVTDLVLEKLGRVLGGVIGGLLDDALGLPIDFNQLFGGGPYTKSVICALRDGQAATPSCTADSASPRGTHVRNGRAETCACDNYDSPSNSNGSSLVPGNANYDDRQLNYMDYDDHSGTVNGVVGLNNGFNWGSGTGIFSGIIPGTATSWRDDVDYGIAAFGGWTTLGGTETPPAPFDLGAWITSQLTVTGNKGISLLLDLAMTPRFTTATKGTYSCFGGTVYRDVSGPDDVVTTRGNAADWSATWDNLDVWAAQNQHMVLGLSQYVAEEALYMLITSGALCLEVSANSLGGGIGDMLKLSNMKMLLPGIDPVTATTPAQKALLKPSNTVTVLMRPSGTPTVRVLGGRNVASVGSAGEWPNGDCVPNDALNTHTNANLLLLDEGGSVGAPCTGGIGSYDLMIALPHFQVEFYIDNGVTQTQIFEQDIDIVLTLAVEYTKTGPATSVYSVNHSKYLEVLVDVWMGCDGTVTKIGEQTGLNADTNPACFNNFNSTVSLNKNGISSLIAMLLSTRLSLLARTTFLLDGLTLEFNKIGHLGSDADTGADAGLKSYQRYGDVTGDWLGIAATLAGNLDLGRLFSFLGGSPASYMMEPETYIVPAMDGGLATLGDPTAIMPGVQYNLSPAQSAEFGFREYGTAFDLYSASAVSKRDTSRDDRDMRFSYSLDGSPWTPFRPIRSLEFKYLPNGFHLLEVRAKDGDDFADSTPAAIAFYVDSIAPEVAIQDGEGVLHYDGSRGAILLDADHTTTLVLNDNVSAASAIRASWSVDGKRWHPLYGASTNIVVPMDSDGVTQMWVKATDEFGNKSQKTYIFQMAPEEDGFGCNATTGGQWSMLAAMLMIGVLNRRRRIA